MEENNNKNQQTINIDFAENEQNNKNQSDSIDSQSVIEEEKEKTATDQQKKKKRGNPQNLIKTKGQFSTLDKQRMHEIAVKGAQASAAAKLRNKKLREIAEVIGNMPVSKKADADTYNVALIKQQYKKALQGDTRATELIMKLLGALNPVEQVQIQQVLSISFDKDNQTIDVTPEEPDKE